MARPDSSRAWIARGTALRWIGIAVVIWLVVSAGAWFGVHGYADACAADALERLRASGAPVLPADLRAAPSRPGADPGSWLGRIAAVERERSATAAGLTLVRQSLVPRRASSLLSSLGMRYPQIEGTVVDKSLSESAECKELSSKCGDVAERLFFAVDNALDEPEAARLHREAALAALRWRVRFDELALKIAREACGVAPADPAKLVADMETTGLAHPRFDFAAVDGALSKLSALARSEALGGDPHVALAALDELLCAASVAADLPWVAAYERWAGAELTALHAAGQCIALLPGDTDFARVAAHLDALDPQGRYLRALEGERAFGNRLFAACADGRELTAAEDDPTDLARGSGLLGATRGLDQAEFLAALDELVAIGRAQPAEACRRVESFERPRRPWFVLAPGLTPLWKSHVHPWAAVEARRRLCQLALLARREGFERARAECAALTDPFDGAPLRSRVEPDGALALWSVGFDRKDDAARPLGESLYSGWPENDDLRLLLPPR